MASAISQYSVGQFDSLLALSDDEVVTHSHLRDVPLPSGGVLALVTLDNGRDHTRPNTLGPAGLAELDAAITAALDTAPDAIAVTGSMPLGDERLRQALLPGGRLFVVVGSAPIMRAHRITRVSDTEGRNETLFETVLPALHNAPRPVAFTF